eukprot:TRINITY_DN716_c0_g1_i1.p1 TRINITY_DN716_c0_g1~~TRINITY_DN716_c0_g1_i1.p1  ORF type:complete len:841 (+),score=171.91 TRINITY_DN716_c0_g1_i1:121-2523(+)
MGIISMAAELFIRPVRIKYTMESLGPPTFNIGDKKIERKDYEIFNEFGLKLQCSHYVPLTKGAGDCIIYLHGSGANRLDSFDSMDVLLAYDISLFCLDLTGAGLSEGKYISLGYHEKNDVKAVLDFLLNNKILQDNHRVGIWGRSMGAATALLYTAQYDSDDRSQNKISALILDSPFASLKRLSKEVVQNAKVNKVPQSLTKAFSNLGLKLVRKSIKKRAKFDINKLAPIAVVDQCKCPVLFIHAVADTLINPQHSQDLYDKYGGENKKIIKVEGTHSSLRVGWCFDEISEFLYTNFVAPRVKEIIPQPLKACQIMDKGSFLCKELPVSEGNMFVSRFQANVVFVINKWGVQLVRPFTKLVLVEYHFDEIVGFWLESSEVFLFKLKANERKPIRTLDGEFFKEEFSLSSFASVYAFYSIEALAIMKIIQEATKELFVQKLLCVASRTHVLQTVVIQTVKQIYSKGERPDPAAVTRDVISYIRDLLLLKEIAEGEMDQILQPVPFFVTSTINRLASEYPNIPDQPSDDKSKNKKSNRQSKRQSTQRDQNIIITPAPAPASTSPSPVQTHIAASIAPNKQSSPAPKPSVELEPTDSSSNTTTKSREVTTDSPRIAPTPPGSLKIIPTPTSTPRVVTTTSSTVHLETAVDFALNGENTESNSDDKPNENGVKDKKHSSKKHKRKKTLKSGGSKTRDRAVVHEDSERTTCKNGVEATTESENGTIAVADGSKQQEVKRAVKKERRHKSERHREHRKRKAKDAAKDDVVAIAEEAKEGVDGEAVNAERANLNCDNQVLAEIEQTL